MLLGLAVFCCAEKPLNYKKLNKQAQKEYLVPIRPGYEGRNPFWNEYAIKFTYAPAFNFSTKKKAYKYRFCIKTKEGELSFDSKSLSTSLQTIWDKIPVGNVSLTVFATDKNGNVLQQIGEKTFYKDFPFQGPYSTPARPYKEAAIKAMLYLHNLPEVQCWADSAVPNFKYTHYTYVNKIVSAVVRNEILVAQYVPSEREKAIQIADSAATFLQRMSQPQGSPLAYFPPTYYKNYIASGEEENQGTVMTRDPCYVIEAFLDLYDAKKERKYLQFAINIAQTYKRIQLEDGSFPIKYHIATGQPTNNRKSMLHPILEITERLHTQYGIDDFVEMQNKAEKWMQTVAVETFDMTGQFEDVSVNNIHPYENLTNCTAAPYASYLLNKQETTQKELEDAKDLIRLSEDQFVHWNIEYNEQGYRPLPTPCVLEQYRFRTPVDNSAVNVANAFLDLYEKTGDKLAFAKGCTLINSIVNQQNAQNGYIPTIWTTTKGRINEKSVWFNCHLSSTRALLRFSELEDKQ